MLDKKEVKNNTIKIVFIFFIASTFCACQENPPARQPNKQIITKTIGKIVNDTDKALRHVFQDSNDNYWFGGGEVGIYKYDGKTVIQFTTQDGLCDNRIHGMQEDAFGNMYFDTSRGVNKFDGQAFSTLKVVFNDSIKNRWKLESNDLWFRMGWDKNGVYRYDGNALYFLKFPTTELGDAYYAKNPTASWTPYGTYSSYKDKKGNLWFGTSSIGVCRFDGKSISWLYEQQLQRTPGGGDFGTRSIVEDGDGFFWINNSQYKFEMLPSFTEKNGTNYIDYKKEKGLGYLEDDGTIYYPYFLSIAEDNEGDLWMVTYSGGVWRKSDNTMTHYPVQDGQKEVLLFTIYKDNHDDLWLGSHNAGVYKYNGTSF